MSFECVVLGYPRPTIQWLKNNIVLTNISYEAADFKLLILSSELGDCMTTECGLSSTLWIFNTTKDDVGQYICKASNVAGSITTAAQLDIPTGNVKNSINCVAQQYAYIYEHHIFHCIPLQWLYVANPVYQKFC